VIIELQVSPDQSRQINHLPAGRSFGEGQAPFARKLLKPVDPWALADVVVEVLHGRP
jgi:hypothetical protein